MPKHGIMGFDEALKEVLDTAVGELMARAAEERTRVHRQGFDEGRSRGFDEGRTKGFDEGRSHGFDEGQSSGFEAGHSQGFDAGHAQGLEVGRAESATQGEAALSAAIAAVRAETAADYAACERLVDAVRELDRGQSLKDVLDTLVTWASRETSRAAVLIVRGQRAQTWRCIGFGSPLDDGSTHDMELDETGVVAQAVRTGATASGETGDHAGPPAFARLPPGHESFAAPIALLGEVVAVLYADHGPLAVQPASDAATPSFQAWPERLEVLTRHASRCLEALTVIKAARSLSRVKDVSAPRTA
jgi:hypothetical protein